VYFGGFWYDVGLSDFVFFFFFFQGMYIFQASPSSSHLNSHTAPRAPHHSSHPIPQPRLPLRPSPMTTAPQPYTTILKCIPGSERHPIPYNNLIRGL